MYLSVAGQPIDAFKGKAKEFVDGLLAGPLSGKPIDPYAIYGGQAAQVMLDAIAASDGSRSDVISKLFASDVQDGLLGTFTFSEDGDPVASGARRWRSRSTRRRTSSRPMTTIAPKQTTVDAALGKVDQRRLQFAGGHCPPANCGLESPAHGVDGDERATRAALTEGRERARLRVRRGDRPVARGQLRQGPDVLRQHRPRRPYARHDLRSRRARLHARLRHPPAHQLRARRRVRALGARREHGDALAAEHHAVVEQRRRRRRGRRRAADHGPAVRPLQRLDRAGRLPAAAQRTTPGTAHHRRRDVVHRVQHLARAVRRDYESGPSSSRRARRSRSATSGSRGSS